MEIHQSAPFFKDLLQQGAKLIAEIRDSDSLGERVKGQFQSGMLDYVTRADTEVADLYQRKVAEQFPNWACLGEDSGKKAALSDLEKEALVLYDPLDGTKLFQERRKGYSTMISVAAKFKDHFRPVLGMFQVIDGEYAQGFNNAASLEDRKNSLSVRGVNTPGNLVVGRTSVERQGFLTPVCQNLGYEVRMIRGLASQTLALVHGETDLFIYEPGLSFWDAYPAIPIIRNSGGDVLDWMGQEIKYDGSTTVCNKGMVAARPQVPKDFVLECIGKVYQALGNNSK